jgi:hypothetical protein
VNLQKFYRKVARNLCTSGWIVLGLLVLGWTDMARSQGQPAPAQAVTPPPSQGTTSPQSPPASPAAPDKTQDNPAAADSEKKISPRAAEELFRSIDEILKFVSSDTSLPIRENVKKRLVDRDQVVAFVRKHMEDDEDAKRLRRSELILKKWGLLPREFKLQTFLVGLLREQVEGYYDPETKIVNMLDWVEPNQQKPVMAHELTHALQDQSFDLDKYMKAGDKDLGTSQSEPTAEDIQNDEISSAHQAVVEGQAMVVSIDYELAPAHQSIVDSPEIVQALKATMLQGTADSVEFRNAPLFIKEALTFPYRYGLDFEATLLTRVGKDKAYAGVFRNPPRTTREIMEPTTYLSGEKIEPLQVPDFKNDFKNYDRFDTGAVGEFDVAILIEQYQGTEISKRLYPDWRGGYYYAVRRKGDASGPLGLLYVSRWSNPERAAEFGSVYAKGLKQRYKQVRELEDPSANPKPAGYTFDTLTGKHAWVTEEGTVLIEVQGSTVLVSESLDDDTTGRLERELFPISTAQR